MWGICWGGTATARPIDIEKDIRDAMEAIKHEPPREPICPPHLTNADAYRRLMAGDVDRIRCVQCGCLIDNRGEAVGI